MLRTMSSRRCVLGDEWGGIYAAMKVKETLLFRTVTAADSFNRFGGRLRANV